MLIETTKPPVSQLANAVETQITYCLGLAQDWYVESDAKISRHHPRNDIQSTDLRVKFNKNQSEISCEPIGCVLWIILWPKSGALV